MIFSKAASFLRRYVLKHPIFVLVYAFGFFSPRFNFDVHFFTEDEIKEELRKGKSLIRFGDGDMVSVPLDLQHSAGRPEPIIKEWYATIVKNYSSKSRYILSVPRFVGQTNKEIKAIGEGKFTLWLPVKTMFFLNYNKSVAYMDAHNFYYDNYFEGVVAPIFKDKKVVLVANKVMIDAQKANTRLPWKDIAYVEAPPYNAIDAYDEIVSNIDRAIAPHPKEDVVLFIAIGPVAKHLVYEYGNRGYQSIDIGRIASTMFTGESIEHLSI